ncbi:hypothetical protein D3C81_1486080 [compost metagenome]
MAAWAGEVAMQHAGWLHCCVCLTHGPTETGQAQLADASRGGAADVGDVAMAKLQQVPGGEVGAMFVVDAHQIGVNPLQLAVDNNHGRAHAGQALQQVAVFAHGRHHQAVDALFQQHTQVAALLLRVVI